MDCGEVCEEYNSCTGSNDIQSGYACDATLCTSRCDDRGLVGEACTGLQGCDISEIVKLEAEVGCSCCASQICGCEADGKTEEAVFGLNKRQREKGITPQCDINGTLCGESRHNGGSSCALADSGGDKSFPILLILPALVVAVRLLRKSRY